tara:strand:+ start:76 stop:498 length:423 start_codon:yes stop_codon:yes gene_type:complete
MQQSFYDEKQTIDRQREDADLIYKCFMCPDPTALNIVIREIRDLTLAEFSNGSERLRTMLNRALSTESRIAKHGALLFGLYLTPDYANKLIQEAKVDPARFRCYYTQHLPTMCQDHLNGKAKFDSMQAFVEEARVRYIII